MFYSRYITDGRETEKLYFDWDEYHKDTFSPDTKCFEFIEFTIHGKTYQDKKQWLYNIAVDWSNNASLGQLYMSDLCIITDWFYRNGKRYGLLEEFYENGLC